MSVRDAVPRRVLIGDFENCAEMIRPNLAPRYLATFGDLARSDLTAYDAVVPLRLSDYPALFDRPGLRGRAFIHPSPDTIALCDDKLALNRFLIAHGFADFIPKLRMPGPPWPWIWKRRLGWWGTQCHIVSNPADEREIDLTGDAWFAQEVIADPREDATHLLRVDGKIRYASTVVYDMASPVFVKGGRDAPVRTRFMPGCAWLPIFSRMLSALNYEGTACIDYKTRDGRPLIFEINPRFGGSLAMDITAYLDAYLRALAPAGATRDAR